MWIVKVALGRPYVGQPGTALPHAEAETGDSSPIEGRHERTLSLAHAEESSPSEGGLPCRKEL